jgi:hypothetical protein
MVSITHYPGNKTLGILSSTPKNLTRRIPAAKSSRFQNILAAFETRNSTNSYKIRGLTIADYRARAVISKSRYRPQPQPADTELKNTVSNRFPVHSIKRTTLNIHPRQLNSRLEAAPTKSLSNGNLDFPDKQEIKDKGLVKKPLNKTRPQPAGLTDRQIIEQNVQKAAAKYNMPPELITAVIRAESNFKTNAVSSAGAQGLMQLMPATAKELGVKNSFDIEQNIDGGTKYLRKMLDRFGGNVRQALAAYNAGPGAVIKYNGRVPYPETRQYIKRVIRFSRQMT